MPLTIFTMLGLLVGVLIGKNLRLQGVILAVYAAIGFYILLTLPLDGIYPLGSAFYPFMSFRMANLFAAILMILALGLVLLLIGKPILAHLSSIPERLDRMLGASMGGVVGFYIAWVFEGVI